MSFERQPEKRSQKKLLDFRNFSFSVSVVCFTCRGERGKDCVVTEKSFSTWDGNEVGRHRNLTLELGDPASQGVTVLSQRVWSVTAEATT